MTIYLYLLHHADWRTGVVENINAKTICGYLSLDTDTPWVRRSWRVLREAGLIQIYPSSKVGTLFDVFVVGYPLEDEFMMSSQIKSDIYTVVSKEEYCTLSWVFSRRAVADRQQTGSRPLADSQQTFSGSCTATQVDGQSITYEEENFPETDQSQTGSRPVADRQQNGSQPVADPYNKEEEVRREEGRQNRKPGRAGEAGKMETSSKRLPRTRPQRKIRTRPPTSGESTPRHHRRGCK